ncbi:trypsin-like serine protease [Microbispora sp. RL4-1S]|uniref:Trypsin-like serine protease n=1 Tax=Microbispora oryzae TaxID=2806554 RepID=A0A940WII5_9ACTN|nr:trypsin-like serine protease [Microbispora oryzae]MBP2703398.1 trypsin-like serine protease [Microbispora oryzae]
MARQLALVIGGVAVMGAAAMLWAQDSAATASVNALRQQDAVRRAAASTTVPMYGSAKNEVSTFPLAPSQADMQRVASYWSPERLRQASSYEPSTKPSTSARATTSAAEMTRVAGPVRKAATAAASTAGTSDTPPMVGKVFFKVGDKEYWCSASAVHSAYRNLVATAGHCAYALGPDKPVENWIFIPSYHDGVTSAGIFVGHTLYMHVDFAGQGDFDRDYAFVTVHRGFTWQAYKDGNTIRYRTADVGRLEDRVGAFRFASSKPIGRGVLAFGYPAGANPDGSRPYDGQSLKSCRGSTEKKFVSAPTWQLEHGVRLPGCAFTSGASGGPWVIGYNAAKRTGYLTGVTSLTWNLNGGGRLDAISSPYFNALTQRVYNQATRQSTG